MRGVQTLWDRSIILSFVQLRFTPARCTYNPSEAKAHTIQVWMNPCEFPAAHSGSLKSVAQGRFRGRVCNRASKEYASCQGTLMIK